MQASDSIIAVFADHGPAETAVRHLVKEGFTGETLSVVGKAYDRGDKAVGFFDVGGQVRFWGERGEFWGRLWNLFSGGLFVTVPVVGPVIVLGGMATNAMSAVDDANRAGGSNAIGVALSAVGIPRDSVLQYEFAVKADGFIVMAHDIGTNFARAHGVLVMSDAARIDTHTALHPPDPTAARLGFRPLSSFRG
jgi:hypothetical protein